MDLIEKKLYREEKYKGVIVDVYIDKVELCDGKTARREVVNHPGGVTILPLDDAGYCYLVRQYRYPVGKALLETPAGKLEYGEEHMACAVRELSEETGFSADEFIDLGCFYTSPGFSTEIIHVYLACGLHAGDMHLDEGEFLNVEKYRFEELIDMAMRGEIDDAKTVIAILKAESYLRAKDRNGAEA